MIFLLDVEGHAETPGLLEEVRTIRCSYSVGFRTFPFLRHEVRCSLVHVCVLGLLRLSLIFGLQSVLCVKHMFYLLWGDIHG